MEEIKSELKLKHKFSFKRILLKIFIILVALVGLSLISLTFIPVKYNVDIHKTEKEEDFNKIINTFNNTFSVDKLANVFFTGKLNNKEEISYNYQYNVEQNIAKKNKEQTKYILFNYDIEQQIMLNGKEYTTSELNSASKMYKQVLVEINNSSSISDCTIYYINESGNSYFRVNFKSSGKKLYELINTYFE